MGFWLALTAPPERAQAQVTERTRALDPLRDLARALHVTPTIIDVIAVLVLLAVSLLAGVALKRLFRRYARKFANTWGELVFSLLESLPVPLLFLAALYTALEEFRLPTHWEHFGARAILVLVIAVLFYFPAKVITWSLRRAGQRRPELERATQPASFLVQVFFAVVAIIVILENLGVHLTVVWTTLGVGSVAVALALQDTLGNFFAGLYILADHPVNLNDFIRLDSGQEGYVARIGWRSTLLRTMQNNLVVVPNSTLAKAVVTNFSMPLERLSLGIPVGVAYGSDARRVETVLVEIAAEAARDRLEGLLSEPPPSAYFNPGFGDSSLNFTLVVQVRRWADQGGVQSELRKRILERFAKEGIEIPFPTRTVALDTNTIAALSAKPPEE
jgi:small-conductance mechanosensitive channel